MPAPREIQNDIEEIRARYELDLNDEDVIDEEINRPTGLLTPGDRAYLLGEKEYENERSEEKRRQDLRQRVRNGFMDFWLLARHLDENDRKTIFAPRTPKEPQDMIINGARYALEFVYQGLHEVGGSFEDVLYPAVEQAEQQLGWANVEITFNVERDVSVRIDDALAKLETGEPLTDEEAGALLLCDTLSREQRAAVRRHLGRSYAEADDEEEHYKAIVERLNSRDDESDESG